MDRAAKERLITLIAWGKSLASVKLTSGEHVRFLLHSPTPDDNALSALKYNDAFAQAKKNGLVMESEKLQHLAERGLWTAEDEAEVKGIKDDILKLRRGLLDFTFQRQKLEKVRKTIRSAETALRDRLTRRYSMLADTAESYATMAQQRFLISRIVHTMEGERLWPTEAEFDDCDDLALIKQLTDQHFEKSIVGDSAMRELARSEPWRPRWTVAMALGASPFDAGMSRWSQNQRALAYWSKVYDNVFEAYERPASEVIEDDDLLDSWFIRQSDKIEQRAKKEEGDKLANSKGGNEVFVLADAEGARRVYEMNDPIARKRLQLRQKTLAQHGEVREQDMPDSQSEMRAQLAAKMSQKVKDISRR